MLFNAEVIAGILLVQLLKPGLKVVVENEMFLVNMQSGAPIFGSVASDLHIAAFSQIWREYRIPNLAGCGWTKPEQLDFQDGHKRSITVFFIAASGINVAFLRGGI